jgi:hypothetical protein
MKYLVIPVLSFLIFACAGQEEKETIDIESSTTAVEEATTTDIAPVDTISKPGETVEYHPNGALKTRGKLNENGNREGLWVAYYDNGIKWSESYYMDGIRDGHSLTFYPNGQVRYIGEYKNDEKIGEWKFYNEDGTLQKEENF